MMKKTIIFVFVLSFLFGLLALPSVASDHKTASLSHEYTSRSKNYFPFRSQITFTSVTTIYLPIVIVSPPRPPSEPGPDGVTGKITFRDERDTYTVGETIFINIEATNTMTESISFGILGLVSSTGSFQSSLINGNIASGKTIKHEDALTFLTPGNHKLWLSICFSNLQECQGPNGDWERFEPGLDVVVQ